jgi:tetratricopeptide (TPR) repeat protein
MTEVNELKDRGNDLFRNKQYSLAKEAYTAALLIPSTNVTLLSTVFTNRAACSLKLQEYQSCIDDCTRALELDSSSVKALYRRALSLYELKDFSSSSQDLRKLLQIDKSNSEGIELMKKVRDCISKESLHDSEVQRWLSIIKERQDELTGLKAIIDLCLDDSFHSLEFAKRGGIKLLSDILNRKVDGNLITCDDTSVRCIRLLAILSSHVSFVNKYFKFESAENPFDGILSADSDLTFPFVLRLMQFCHVADLLNPCLLLVMNILKNTPTSPDFDNSHVKKSVEENIIKVNDEYRLYMPVDFADLLIKELINKLQMNDKNIYPQIADCLLGFLSDNKNYFDPNIESDTRRETLPTRRIRLRQQFIVSERSKLFCKFALQQNNLLKILSTDLVNQDLIIRQTASSSLGKLIKFYSNDEEIKPMIESILPHEDELDLESSRRCAALEATLLTTHQILGIWTMQQIKDQQHLLKLIVSGETKNVEVAIEVICLAAATDSINAILSRLVEDGVLLSLLHSPQAGIRAAAASALTKVAIKSKALNRDSNENAQILNAVVSVLRKSVHTPDQRSSQLSESSLISFSSYDNIGLTKGKKIDGPVAPDYTDVVQGSEATMMTSVERAIEVLSALSSHTYIKEEIVHGSYRIVSCLEEISKVEIDMRSTTAFGIAHIYSQVTVTNRELKALALAEKEMTVEQYDQLQELQRIKTTDENGNVIEEKKEEFDHDTVELCKLRIRKVVLTNGIKRLIK